MDRWLYFGFTLMLVIILAVIIFYYFNPKRSPNEKEKTEKPKYRMLDDE
ncbi:MAG: CcoQ/FixQ family Cbb3-type cytochrome c oxidase assembly chaperone [Nitrospirae bacterium]|nr:CcoQ/FixQ family Cbb3-type cytochrome c oxidase assembly chaperone [Nitrospirota bacterium]